MTATVEDGRLAVVGAACLLPGARTPEEFWEVLRSGGDVRTEGGRRVFGTDASVPGGWGDAEHAIVATRGGFVDEPAVDLTGLAVPEHEMSGLDRVFRWSIHVAREALRDAGIEVAAGDPADASPLARTGLVLGNYSFPTSSSDQLCAPFLRRAVGDGLARVGLAVPGDPAWRGEPAPENLWPFGGPATLAATALGLGGPTLALDAACASALYGVALSRDYLLSGRADVMVAGAVCVPDPLLLHLAFSDLHAYPRDGRSQPFDANSGGIVTGQGAGLLVLKRLVDAQQAGDRIHAVVESIGLSNDGAGRHVLAPDESGQVAAYRRAYVDVDPRTVDYVECHATGTPLGDATELRGLRTFFAEHDVSPPLLGSVKGNVGHLLTVAGFTSVLKTVLAMQHGTIPATPGVSELLRPDGVGDRVVREATPWPPGAGPRRAAVSSFGFGGTNAHLVLCSPDEVPSGTVGTPRPAATEALAVLGLGALVGSLRGVGALQSAAREGRTVLGARPAQRWYGAEALRAGPLGGTVLDGADPPGAHLDEIAVRADVYRIPPKELEQLNPQHLAMFDAAEQALDDAGYTAPVVGTRTGAIPERRVAVVLAMELEPRTHAHRARFDVGRQVRDELDRARVTLSAEDLDALESRVRTAVHDRLGVNEVLSYVGNIMASRICATRNLTGPSFTLAAGPTTGARALEVAQLLLRDQTIEAVLVGGVDLVAGVELTRARARLATVVGSEVPPGGDGAAAVLVGRDDGSRPAYAVLEGLGLARAEDASTAVARAARSALTAADVPASDTEYLVLGGATLEARRHESAALAAVFPAGDDPHACVVGSLVPLVGDTGSASMLLALVHAVLVLHTREFPAAPDALPEPDAPALAGSAFSTLADPQPWVVRDQGSRPTAAVSAVGEGLGSGLGGASDEAAAAAVLLRAPAPDRARSRPDVAWSVGPGFVLAPLAAPDGRALAGAAAELRARLTGDEDAQDVLRAAREVDPGHGPVRAVLVAPDAAALRHELAAAERDVPDLASAGREWLTPTGSFATPAPLGPGPVAFVYPGAFTTYPGAGRDLFRLFPALLAGFEAESGRPAERYKHRALHPRGRGPLGRRDTLRREADLLGDVPLMLAAGTNHAVLVTRLLRDLLGLCPDGALGYSLGESSMLFATGVWADTARDDAALAASPLFARRVHGRKELVREAWELPDELPDDQVWSTRVLLAEPDRVRAAIAGSPRLFLTHVNTPNEVVVAGAPDELRALVERLGCRAAKAPADQVMHCPLLDEELDALQELNDYPLSAGVVGTELLSAFDDDRVPTDDRREIARRIAHTLKGPVDFVRLVREAHCRGYRYFVEVGPAATCTRWIEETLAGEDHVAASVDRRGASTASGLARVLARLVAHGVPVDLERLTATTELRPASSVRRVRCGGPAVADRVAAAAAEVLPARLPDRPDRAAVTSRDDRADDGVRPSADDGLVVEGTPFVHLGHLTQERRPSGEFASGEVPSGEVPSGEVPSGEVPSGEVPSGEVPSVGPTSCGRGDPIGRTGRPRRVRPGRASREPGGTTTGAGSALAEAVAALAGAHRRALRAQQAVVAADLAQLAGLARPADPGPPADLQLPPPPPPAPEPPSAVRSPPGLRPDARVVLDADDLLEFASGRLAPVFGPEFAEIDGFPRRCRLPEPPYHFVSRVVELDATARELAPGRIVTEYDVPVGAWYAVDGLVPCAVTIEAGQCDMLLISYMGADLLTRGERVYRLLDARLVFRGALPREGQTLRYDIRISRFVRQGDGLLFFFDYRCYADGELILELLEACAGFFAPAELAEPLGVVENAADRARRAARRRTSFKPLARTDRTSLGADDLALLAEGRPGEVFGPAWDRSADGVNRSVRLPGSMLRMIDEITVVDRLGGCCGLGALTASTRLDPDGWYFRCHFAGDPVLAGSLVAEGGVQLLQVYAMFLGLHLVFPDAEFQSVPDLETRVRVRGQITPRTAAIRYEVEVTAVTLLPRPTVIADITVYDGAKPVVAMTDFGVQVRERPGTAFRPLDGGVPPFLGRRNDRGEVAFINELHLAHAARGDLGVAMGREFEVYHDHRAPHIPNGDFQFVDRIMRLEGTRGRLVPGATMSTEYDSPAEAWYHQDDPAGQAPHCVIMETSLQAAILLGYYLGATLDDPDAELSIRNLDGRAVHRHRPELRGRTIRHESELLSSIRTPSAILQRFRYRLLVDDVLFHEGESLFGYFTEAALASQVGLDRGEYVPPWIDRVPGGLEPGRVRTVEVAEEAWTRPAPDTGLRLAAGRLDLLDSARLVPDGGEHGLGYLHGRRRVDPGDWYFERHFHRDPVMPGSLGVEAVLQGLRLLVLAGDLTDGLGPSRFVVPLDVPMSWRYRGQVLRDDGEMSFELHVTSVRRTERGLVVIADAYVWKPGMRIYELGDVAVEVVPEEEVVS